MKRLLLTLMAATFFVFAHAQERNSIGGGLQGLSIQSPFKTGFGYTSRLFLGGGAGPNTIHFSTSFNVNGIYRYSFGSRFGIYGGIGYNTTGVYNFSKDGSGHDRTSNNFFQAPIGVEFFPFQKKPRMSMSVEGIFSPVRTGFFYFNHFGFTPNFQLNFYLKPKE